MILELQNYDMLCMLDAHVYNMYHVFDGRQPAAHERVPEPTECGQPSIANRQALIIRIQSTFAQHERGRCCHRAVRWCVVIAVVVVVVVVDIVVVKATSCTILHIIHNPKRATCIYLCVLCWFCCSLSLVVDVDGQTAWCHRIFSSNSSSSEQSAYKTIGFPQIVCVCIYILCCFFVYILLFTNVFSILR